ncbi:MAG: hypothetical protein WDN69_02755 [Aliidongia sp.]
MPTYGPQAGLTALSLVLLCAASPAQAQQQTSTTGTPAAPPGEATEQISVVAKRLNEARDSISPSIGASTYTFTHEAIENLPGGENNPIDQITLQAPGVDQDNLANGGLHVRNEHLNVQYRINGVILPDGVSFFGQSISPRFVGSMDLVTGALPAEYGLRTAGIIDIDSKSDLFQSGGQIGLYGGSYGHGQSKRRIWRLDRRLQLFRLRRLPAEQSRRRCRHPRPITRSTTTICRPTASPISTRSWTHRTRSV